MTQRLYHQERYYESESKTQREKVSKMAEIENYVGILIDNNRAYGDQLNMLRKENTQLRGQIEVMMGEMLKLKQNYQEVMTETKGQYSKEVGSLIEELKDILNKKQQMEGSYKSLLEELSYQSEYDRKARSQQLEQLERNYENKVKILNDRIQDQNKQIEKSYYLNSDGKLRLVKQIDGLSYQLAELKKQNNDLQQAEMFHHQDITRLSVSLKLLNKEKEEMGVNLLKIEQQKNQYIIELKQSATLMRQQLDSQIDNVKKLQIALIAKQKQIQQISEKYENQRRESDSYQDLYHKLSNDLNQKERDFTNIDSQFHRLSDYSTKQIKRLTELIRTLETDNIKLSKQKKQLQSKQQINQDQILTLLDKIQNVQIELEATNANMLNLAQQNSDIKRIETQLRDQYESLLLDHKNQRERGQLQMNRIQTLEQIIQKEKRRNLSLQTTNTDREIVSKHMPNEIVKKYEFQIEEILRRTAMQKNDLLQRFDSQKQRLVRMYEKALREKQLMFKQKISIMESDIRELALK